jgi:hypothetical protein
MVTKAQQEAIDLYAALMEEAKIRIGVIDTCINNKLGVHGAIAQELCFLQLRMLCELIALGCLVAHGDIKETRQGKLTKEWSVEIIFKELENLHKDFYPEAVKPGFQLPIGTHIEQMATGFLTKAELLKLHRRTGDKLHRGNLKKLMKPRSRDKIQADWTDVVSWANKIQLLLRSHVIALFGGQLVICSFGPKDGRVEVGLAERVWQAPQP